MEAKECTCSDGFSAQGNAKVCVPSGSTAATTDVDLAIEWLVDCSQLDARFEALLEEVIIAVFGNFVVSFTLSCGSVQASGVLAGVTYDAVAASDLTTALEERYTNDARYSDMQTSLGTPTSTRVSLLAACSVEGASAATRTSATECAATACTSGYSLSGTVCEEDSSSSLSSGAIAGIVVGCVVAVGLVAVVVVVLLCRGGGAKETEPVKEAPPANEPVKEAHPANEPAV